MSIDIKEIGLAPHPALVGGYDLLGEFADYDQMVNGNFDDGSGWNFADPAWTIGSGVANCDGSQAGNAEMWRVSDIVIGKKYRTIYTLLNRSAGQVNVKCGNSTHGTVRTADGTYVEDLICTGNTNISFLGDSSFIGDVDNVSFQQLYTPDYSGRANHGTVNGATATPWGYDFNDTTDFINLGSSVGDYTDNFTIMARIKTDAAFNDEILSRREAVNVQWGWYLDSANDALTFYDGSQVTKGDTNLSDNIEHHVCTVINGANSRHYVDGRIDSVLFLPSITSQSLNTIIGAFNDGASGNFNNVIRDVRIYNRALTQREIQEEIRRSTYNLKNIRVW